MLKFLSVVLGSVLLCAPVFAEDEAPPEPPADPAAALAAAKEAYEAKRKEKGTIETKIREYADLAALGETRGAAGKRTFSITFAYTGAD